MSQTQLPDIGSELLPLSCRAPSSETGNYGSSPLGPSNKPAKEWLTSVGSVDKTKLLSNTGVGVINPRKMMALSR